MLKDKHLGIIYIIFSAFCFSLMNMFVQLAGDVPFIQKSFFRNFVALLCAVFVIAEQSESSATFTHWGIYCLPMRQC